MKHPEPKSAKATSGDYGFLLGWLWDLPCNLSGKLRLFVKPALEFYMLGQSLLALPKWPQGNSKRLGLRAWLQNASPCQEPLEINFFQLGLEAHG